MFHKGKSNKSTNIFISQYSMTTCVTREEVCVILFLETKKGVSFDSKRFNLIASWWNKAMIDAINSVSSRFDYNSREQYNHGKVI